MELLSLDSSRDDFSLSMHVEHKYHVHIQSATILSVYGVWLNTFVIAYFSMFDNQFCYKIYHKSFSYLDKAVKI